jgi:hypothetical protein
VAGTFELFDHLNSGEWEGSGAKENRSRHLSRGERALFPRGVYIACLSESGAIDQPPCGLAKFAFPVGPNFIALSGPQQVCPPARLVREDLPVSHSPARKVVRPVQSIQKLRPTKDMGINLVWKSDWPNSAREDDYHINVTSCKG